MKKAFLLITIFGIIALCSCVESKEPIKITLPIRITARLDGSDALFTADISETHCDITFDERHALSGTELHFSNEGNTATCGGFTKNVKAGIFPAQESFVKALRIIGNSENQGIYTEDGIKYTIDEMTIMVYYDKDTELLTGIRTEENGRRYDFTVVGFELYEGQSNSQG